MTETKQSTDMEQTLQAMAKEGSVELFWVSYESRWGCEWHTWSNGKYEASAPTPAEAVKQCHDAGLAE